jgi:hypothetical protein
MATAKKAKKVATRVKRPEQEVDKSQPQPINVTVPASVRQDFLLGHALQVPYSNEGIKGTVQVKLLNTERE